MLVCHFSIGCANYAKAQAKGISDCLNNITFEIYLDEV